MIHRSVQPLHLHTFVDHDFSKTVYRIMFNGQRSSQFAIMSGFAIRVSFALDKNCWVCGKWLLHSIVTASKESKRACNGNGDKASLATVESSNHFVHTQQFLSNAKLTLKGWDQHSQRAPMDEFFFFLHSKTSKSSQGPSLSSRLKV